MCGCTDDDILMMENSVINAGNDNLGITRVIISMDIAELYMEEQ